MDQPTLYLFGGCNGAGKTTFARAYLTAKFPEPLRFLNADEIARDGIDLMSLSQSRSERETTGRRGR